jgi:hypothetical protein
MDLLTFVGVASRRRESYEERARDLASSYSSLEGLEEEMEERAEKLALRLKESRVTFSEFRRAVAEDTLVSSLAALMLGRENDENLPQNAFMEAMGQMKYLWNFFDDIKLSLIRTVYLTPIALKRRLMMIGIILAFRAKILLFQWGLKKEILEPR